MGYNYSGPLARLINEFAKMPGIGPKSAQRLAFYILSADKASVSDLVRSINEVKSSIHYCKRCYNLTENEVCEICEDQARDRCTICVVAEPKDLIAMDKTNVYRGLYHILGGLISPINGIGPEALRIRELLDRLKTEEVQEIIFAFNPNVEAEATLIYLTRLVKPLGIRTSRIACGLPVGSDMDYADENTLSKAYEGRVSI